MSDAGYIPIGTSGQVKFSMLREQHFHRAEAFFGTTDFDRLFVVHAINPAVLDGLKPAMTGHRVNWLTIHQVVTDLREWYTTHEHQTSLRNTLAGDLWHLLFGYCKNDI
jgi:hypothetical protein